MTSPEGTFGRKIRELTAGHRFKIDVNDVSQCPGSHDENDERQKPQACSIRANE